MITYKDEILVHYGVPGMRWGVRRYQNRDGSLTKAGQKRYQKVKDEKKKWDERHESQNSYMEEYRKRKGRPEYSDVEKRGKKLSQRFDDAQYKLLESYAKDPQRGQALGIKDTVKDMKKTSIIAYRRTPAGKTEYAVQAGFGLIGSLINMGVHSIKSVSASDRFDFYREFGGKRYDEYSAKVAEYEKKAREAKKGV